MTIKPKLTTIAACRIAGLHRDRFNEYVAAGQFECAPKTTAGRARLFDPDDMVPLMLFKRLMDDGMSPREAGNIACMVGHGAKIDPQEDEVVYVETFAGFKTAFAVKYLTNDPIKWDGMTIYKKTIFNIGHIRKLIAHYTEEERSIIGPDDE